MVKKNRNIKDELYEDKIREWIDGWKEGREEREWPDIMDYREFL